MLIRPLDKYIKQEGEIMYYVYVYINPETNMPMYVGKGSADRAYSHLQDRTRIDNERFRNKLNSLHRKGLEPRIEFLAQNICVEDIAYELEESFISKYGRKGYDENGTLLNICKSARPPSHKGKTYKEIYGDRWQEQIEKRRKIQLERGGYGPKKHSKETIELLRKKNSGENNGTYGVERTKQWRDNISKGNKGKRRKNAMDYIFDYSGTQTKIKGSTDAEIFCKENNISLSTLRKNNYHNMGRCKKGKTKGWILYMNKHEEN